jgi:hypothetical protein
MKRIVLIGSGIIFLVLVINIIRFIKTPATITVYTSKPGYYHYEFIRILVKPNLRYTTLAHVTPQEFIDNTSVYVARCDSATHKEIKPVTTIGNKKMFKLIHDTTSAGTYYVDWPCPWNVQNGEYKPVLLLKEKARVAKGSTPLIVKSFFITSRNPGSIEKLTGFPILSVLTFENLNPIDGLVMKKPDGTKTDWTGIIDWTLYTGANAFWCLGGSTMYYDKPLPEEFPWITYNFGSYGKVGRELHKHGIKFGVWAIGYLTFGNTDKAPKKYKYAIDYRNGKLEKTRSVSLSDETRIIDLANFYKRLEKIPEIDFYGIDYIRNALGGYELVDEFVTEMNIQVPPDFLKKSFDDRMKWLARKKIDRKDKPFIDQWQWWLAHKSATNLHKIITLAGIKKPFWAYTLSWEKGWQHGQDPVMMSDAGADIDAVMLYECTRQQYDGLVKDWNSYKLTHERVNLIVGDVVDWPLHQSTLNPAGPEELYYRTVTAVKKFYIDGYCKGVFIHDLSRALWGRTGPWPAKQWLKSGKNSIVTTVMLNKQK